MRKLKAVVFDYGNVLSLPQDPRDIESMALCLALETSEFLNLYWQFRLPYDKGEIDAGEYWSEVAALCGVMLTASLQADLVRLDNSSWSRPRREVLSWVESLQKSGMPTAILSNMPADLQKHIETSCDWLPAFTHKTFSCQVKSVKPEADIYHHCLDGLNSVPEAVLFLDDRPDNIAAARNLGINAVLFTTPEDTLQVLQSNFQLPCLNSSF